MCLTAILGFLNICECQIFRIELQDLEFKGPSKVSGRRQFRLFIGATSGKIKPWMKTSKS